MLACSHWLFLQKPDSPEFVVIFSIRCGFYYDSTCPVSRCESGNIGQLDKICFIFEKGVELLLFQMLIDRVDLNDLELSDRVSYGIDEGREAKPSTVKGL